MLAVRDVLAVLDCTNIETQCGADGSNVFMENALDDRGLTSIVKTAKNNMISEKK